MKAWLMDKNTASSKTLNPRQQGGTFPALSAWLVSQKPQGQVENSVCQCFIGSLACDLAPWAVCDLG